MTKQEVKNLLALAIANFPNMQDKNMAPTAALWEKMLGDIPYELAEKALVKVLAMAKYFPTVAEIREAAIELQHGRPLSADEAWELVTQAIRRYGYYRELEAMASLPPEVAAMVRRFGWREICYCEEPEVIRGQWRRAWEGYAAREREMAVLPSVLRDMIELAAERKRMPELPRLRILPGGRRVE